MSFPVLLDNAVPANSESPSLGAARIRALTQALEDLFGLPNGTNITAAIMSLGALVDGKVASLPVAKAASPGQRLIGTEGGARDLLIREDAGGIYLLKNTGTEGAPVWTPVWVFDFTPSFALTLVHSLTANRAATFPDRSITVAGLDEGLIQTNYTNRTGGGVVLGDVVAPSAANDSSVVLADTASVVRPLVVAQATIADTVGGRFASHGISTVNVTGAVTRGNYLRKSVTTKVAADAGVAAATANPPAGSFAVALTSAAGPGAGTVVALLFGTTALALVAQTYTNEFTGLGLANNVGDTTNDIDIAVGAAASDDAVIASRDLISLATALTKQIDATWVVGTNQGGRDGGTLINGTYHTYAIKRTDTGVADALFSLNNGLRQTFTVTIASPGVITCTDHGLQIGSSFVPTTTGALPTGMTAGTRYYVISAGFTVDAFQFSASEGGGAINTTGSQSGTHTLTAGPILPTNYDKEVYLGSILREGGVIVPFVQDLDFFQRKGTVLDINTANPGATAILATMKVPVGVYVEHQGNWEAWQNDATAFLLNVSDPATTDEATSRTAAPLGVIGEAVATASGNFAEKWTRTSRAAQVRYRVDASNANTTIRCATRGWRVKRGNR